MVVSLAQIKEELETNFADDEIKLLRRLLLSLVTALVAAEPVAVVVAPTV
jgi:hypothetical protein